MATRSEREARDALILRLHLAGIGYRDIGRRAGLSLGAVHKVVKRELAKAADRRDDLEDDAITMHLERLDSLYAVNYAKAAQGDTRSAEVCRRILDSMARVQGLNTSVAERLAPERNDPDFDDDLDDGEGMVIDLEAMRWVRNNSSANSSGSTT
jgi:hypothetical protein